MSAKRSVWALIGKVLWAIVRTIVKIVLKVVATLGSRWARKKLDQHEKQDRHDRRTRTLRRAVGRSRA